MPDGFIKLGGIDLDSLILTLRDHANGKLGHLSNLLLERHALEQGLDLLRIVTLWASRANSVFKELIAIVDVGSHRCSGRCLCRRGVRVVRLLRGPADQTWN